MKVSLTALLLAFVLSFPMTGLGEDVYWDPATPPKGGNITEKDFEFKYETAPPSNVKSLTEREIYDSGEIEAEPEQTVVVTEPAPTSRPIRRPSSTIEAPRRLNDRRDPPPLRSPPPVRTQQPEPPPQQPTVLERPSGRSQDTQPGTEPADSTPPSPPSGMIDNPQPKDLKWGAQSTKPAEPTSSNLRWGRGQ